MNNKIIFLIVIIALAVLGYVYQDKLGTYLGSTTKVEITVPSDTIEVINTEVQNIDIGDLGKDFEAIDKDINTL
jgi:hypothetical protein